MRRSALNWWQWLLLGIGCFAGAIITGPLADRPGYATFVGLITSLVFFTASTVCFVVEFIGFVKWI
jgi:predicted MFS family arabinose efflux permease